MSDSLFGRIKGQIKAAGEGAQKLTRKSKLKLDRVSAETTLRNAYRDLGKLVANSFIDREASEVRNDEALLGVALDGVRRARRALEEIDVEIAACDEDHS